MMNLLSLTPSGHVSDALLRIDGVLDLDQETLVQIKKVAVLLGTST